MTDLQQRLSASFTGTYVVEAELGGGGMSRVFLATEQALGRRVVIKVLPPDLPAQLNADRFRREIQLAASLQHPHIVPLLQAGEADGLLYYTMPFLEGESLRGRLAREGELSVRDALRILRDVVDALASAHRHGVIHRDIKPENILLAERHAAVTDFGVAKALWEAAGGTWHTGTGIAIGTPSYMAPEQASGDPHVDHRLDIYAVGVLAYEMLTGHAPFSGPSAQAVISQHLVEAPAPIMAQRPAVPPPLAELVMRCLEKKPADRWQSAEELLEAIEAMIAPLLRAPAASPPAARAPARFWRFPRFPIPSPRAGVWGAGVLAVAIVLVVVARRLATSGVPAETLVAIHTAAEQGRLDDVAALLVESGLRLDAGVLSDIAARVGGTLRLETDPPGAAVTARRVGPIETFAQRVGVPLGTTPLTKRRLVAGDYLLRLAPRGGDTLNLLVAVDVGAETAVQRTLLPAGSTWRGMVLVERGSSALDAVAPPVPAFLIDRHEVTNGEYARFVASGGYRDSTYWDSPLVLEGRTVAWPVAMRGFVDRTGLAGPREWSGGTYPTDRADHPVTGVNWYEARAYARWAGKELPSTVQWYRAALGNRGNVYPWGRDARTTSLRANFNLKGTTAVGAFPLGVSPFGCFDMAGNVREWLRDAARGGRQYLVAGGSWQDPSYMFDAEHLEGFDPGFAGEGVGFRLVTALPGNR